jgi:flagellar hook-associated protein 2
VLADIGGTGNIVSLLRGPEPAITQAGSRAVVYLGNGDRIEQDSNVIDFRGVRLTLNDTTGPNDEPIEITFRRDAEEPYNRIRDFINAYNEIVQRLETLTSERQSRAQRTYRPLTRDEMANMSEREIEDWNSIARIGIMRNDSSLERLTISIRRAFFDEIQGMGMSASQIGLTTGRHSDGTGGQIIIDEDRLRAALENDPDMVADIFARIESGPDGPEGVGLMHRLDGLFGQFVNVSQPDSLRGLEDSLRRTNEQIERMEARMFAEEDRLFRQFAAMEAAMSNMQNQGQWFNSMLGM